jgi:Holliday junction resolvase
MVRRNNKEIGTSFERDMVEFLASIGYWVHFIVPDKTGAQPFDIIAVKDGMAYAIDCKTCEADIFSMGRLEYNQITSFERWRKCGNTEPLLAIFHKGKVFYVTYEELKLRGKIDLRHFKSSIFFEKDKKDEEDGQR